MIERQIDLFVREPTKRDLLNDETRLAFWASLPIRYEDHPSSLRASKQLVFRRRSFLPDRTLGGVCQYGGGASEGQ